jgi:hypothetical protein
MMAWGIDATTWDTSVDIANIDAYPEGIPDEHFVLTTWHDDEPLSEVFWFSGFCGIHPDVEIIATLILHICEQPREAEMVSAYIEALKD